MDKGSNARIAGILVTVMAAAGYAGNNVLVALAYGQGATPTAVLFLRYVVLIAGLLIILPMTGQSLALPRRFFGHAIAAGCLASFDSLCLITAFGLIPIGLALLILYFYPIFTAILQSLIERTPVSPAQFGCLLTAFAGLAIALGAGGEGFASHVNFAGVLCAFGAGLGSAGFFIWSRYGLAGAEPGATTLFTSLAGAVIAAFAGVAFYVIGLMPFHTPGPSDGFGWLLILALSICFSIGYFGMSLGVQMISATRVTMLMNLETVFTMPLAFVILGEALDARRLAGATLVLTSVVVSQWLAANRPA